MLPQTRLFLFLLKRRCIQKFQYSIKIGDKPLGSIFFHPKVQFLMKKLTKIDYDKLFEVRKMDKPLRDPVYTLMTDEELERERAKIDAKAVKLLQMPPLVDVTNDKIEVLANDSSLDGHDAHHAKFVFMDVSLDIKHMERVIVVREPAGLLRTANKNETNRMNQIYFPVRGKELHTPKMFEPEHLQKVLDRKDYEFILNRASIQFRPQDEDYHSVLATTFEHINAMGDFDKLIRTRYFGPFTLYLAINKNINKLMRFFLQKNGLMEASYLVNLLRIVHTEAPWSIAWVTEEDERVDDLLSFEQACTTVKNFINDKSNDALKLEPYFDVVMKKLKDEEELKSETLKAHGISSDSS